MGESVVDEVIEDSGDKGSDPSPAADQGSQIVQLLQALNSNLQSLASRVDQLEKGEVDLAPSDQPAPAISQKKAAFVLPNFTKGELAVMMLDMSVIAHGEDPTEFPLNKYFKFTEGRLDTDDDNIISQLEWMAQGNGGQHAQIVRIH